MCFPFFLFLLLCFFLPFFLLLLWPSLEDESLELGDKERDRLRLFFLFFFFLSVDESDELSEEASLGSLSRASSKGGPKGRGIGVYSGDPRRMWMGEPSSPKFCRASRGPLHPFRRRTIGQHPWMIRGTGGRPRDYADIWGSAGDPRGSLRMTGTEDPPTR